MITTQIWKSNVLGNDLLSREGDWGSAEVIVVVVVWAFSQISSCLKDGRLPETTRLRYLSLISLILILLELLEKMYLEKVGWILSKGFFNYFTGTHKRAPEVFRSSSGETIWAAGGLGRVQGIFWKQIHNFELKITARDAKYWYLQWMWKSGNVDYFQGLENNGHILEEILFGTSIVRPER